jgi:predicted small lipoprotein YifL
MNSEFGIRNSELPASQSRRAGGWKFEIRNSKFEIEWHVGLVAAIVLLLLVGCGKEGPPLPPEIRVAERTTDLTAFQEGDHAILRWSYPSLTTDGSGLTDVEAIQVWRATLPEGQEPPPPISAQDRQLRRQLLEGEGEVIKELEPEELAAITHGADLIFRDDLARWRESEGAKMESPVLWYGVRTVCCRKRESVLSNVVRLEPQTPPPPPEEVELGAGADGIDVRWRQTDDLATLVERSADGATWNAVTDEPVTGGEWRDSTAAQGRSWSYRLRSVRRLEGGEEVIGKPSRPARVDHPDTYPPSSPQGVVCLPEGPRVRVRWQAVAGDVTYRIARQKERAEAKVLADGLQVVELTDPSPPLGALRYTVVAVDTAGNESVEADCTVVMGAEP